MLQRFIQKKAAKAAARRWQLVTHLLDVGEKRIDYLTIDVSDTGLERWGTLYLTEQRILWTVMFPDWTCRVLGRSWLHEIDRVALGRQGRQMVIGFVYPAGVEHAEEAVRPLRVAAHVPDGAVPLFYATLKETLAAAHVRRGEEPG